MSRTRKRWRGRGRGEDRGREAPPSRRAPTSREVGANHVQAGRGRGHNASDESTSQ